MQPKTNRPVTEPQSTVKSLGKGYMRAIILALLAEHPRCGYDILEALAETSNGWRPSPGTIYPMLHDLHERGLITKKAVEQEGRRRIIYRLKAKGKQHLEHDAMEHVRFVAMMRKLLIKHGSPNVPGTPALNVDEMLEKLQQIDLLLDEASILSREVASDSLEGKVLLQHRLRLLENHVAIIEKVIHSVRMEIQNHEKESLQPESEL